MHWKIHHLERCWQTWPIREQFLRVGVYADWDGMLLGILLPPSSYQSFHFLSDSYLFLHPTLDYLHSSEPLVDLFFCVVSVEEVWRADDAVLVRRCDFLVEHMLGNGHKQLRGYFFRVDHLNDQEFPEIVKLQ